MMKRLVTSGSMCGFVVILCSCVHDQQSDTAQSGAGTQEVMADDGYESVGTPTAVHSLMQIKLSHAQGLLEGILLADYVQIEANAMALKRISESSDWLVHDSAAYYDYSESFRTICSDFMIHARAKDLEATTSDFNALMTSCIDCHTYLRTERQLKDVPGRVSMRQ